MIFIYTATPFLPLRRLYIILGVVLMSQDNFLNHVEAIYKLIGLNFKKMDFYAFDVDDTLEGYLFVNSDRFISLYSVGELLPSSENELIHSMLEYNAPDKNGLLTTVCLLDHKKIGLWGSIDLSEPTQKAIDLFMYTLEESEKWNRCILSNTSYFDENNINHRKENENSSKDQKKNISPNISFGGLA